MKKDMKKVKPTSDSLEKIKYIANTMASSTFHFHTHLLYDIRTLLGDSTKTYLEIGSFAGASLSLVASHPYTTKCYNIDLGYPIASHIVEANVATYKNQESTFQYCQGNSQDASVIRKVAEEVGEVDLLFIDGDHSRRGVLADFHNYGSLVKEGGYIVFDDYLDHKDSPEVRGAVDEIVKQLDQEEYDVIGTLRYPLLETFSTFDSSNLFILHRKAN